MISWSLTVAELSRYGKCAKISNTFPVLKYNDGYQGWNSLHACQKDPDQTASSYVVWSWSALFVIAFVADNYCLKF